MISPVTSVQHGRKTPLPSSDLSNEVRTSLDEIRLIKAELKQVFSQPILINKSRNLKKIGKTNIYEWLVYSSGNDLVFFSYSEIPVEYIVHSVFKSNQIRKHWPIRRPPRCSSYPGASQPSCPEVSAFPPSSLVRCLHSVGGVER